MAQDDKKSKRTAGLVESVVPKFISLVKSPANRSSFKTIRSDDKDTATKNLKRFDEGLLSVTLPIEVTRDEAEQILIAYGLTGDYEVRQNMEGNYILARIDVSNDLIENIGEIDGVTAIRMSSGMVAHISDQTLYEGAPAIVRYDKQGMEVGGGITLTGIEFNEDFFADGKIVREDAETWLEKNIGPDSSKNIEVVEGGVIYTRFDSFKDIKKVKLGDGITGLITRSESTDVPKTIRRMATTEAFGSYGYGHIDFASALVDPEFSDKSWDAIWVLQDVLENIVFYSNLPLEERKVLIDAALSQYSMFMTNLIDSMPRNILEQMNGSSDDEGSSNRSEPNLEANMAEKDKKDDNVEDKNSRSDDNQSDDSGDEKISMTRSEFDTAVTDAAAKAVEAALAARKDDDKQDDSDADDASTDTRSDDTGIDPVLAAIKEIGEKVDGIATRQDSLDEDVKKLGEETIARSDEDDEGEDGQDGGTTKRVDVFDGAFGTMGGLRNAG